jgi:hypothetical protein
MKALEIIKNGKGIQGIVKYNKAAKTADGGEIVDLYQIAYYTRQGNIAFEEGMEGDPRIAEILAFNASLPSFRQKRIQSR